jgi:hypothetical protein
MATITDDQMHALMQVSKPYSVVILTAGPNRDIAERDAIVWEHGRRNMSLRADGLLSIVCPVRDGTDVNGVGIFHLDVEQTREVMEGDPGVRAGVFVYEIHACRSFPGDSLPG